jgi:hypothetical protein
MQLCSTIEHDTRMIVHRRVHDVSGALSGVRWPDTACSAPVPTTL